MSEFITLGVPASIGELKKMIEPFDDATSFGFRNQAMQELMVIKNDYQLFVVFNETRPRATKEIVKECLLKIVRDSELIITTPINPWISIDDKSNRVPNDPAIQIELLFGNGDIKDFDDHHPFEIITHWRIKKQIIGYENDSQQ